MGSKLRQHLCIADQMVGSASALELALLFVRYGLRLAEPLTAECQTHLRAAVAARDALLAGQSRSIVQRLHKRGGSDCIVRPGRKQLDRQAKAAALTQLDVISRCLAFSENLACAVAAAQLKLSPKAPRLSPKKAASLVSAVSGTDSPSIGSYKPCRDSLLQLPFASLPGMRSQANPTLAQALREPEVAKRWLEWRAVTGAHTSQEQAAEMWQTLGSSGAKAQLFHHLGGLRRRSDEACKRRAPPGPPLHNTTCRDHMPLHW